MRYTNPDEELAFLRKRVAELETQTQQLYQQVFLLQQRLSTSDLNEKERVEFISHVAHELRTPLTSIKGYIDLVLEGETGAINDIQREFLGVVGINAEKLSNIIGDLLDVSRLEAGQLGFKPVITDLQMLVLQTCAEVRPQLESRNLQFEVIASNNNQLVASIDPERLSQALRAIIAHAGQVTPPEHKVTVSIGLDATNCWGVIKIEDQGPGIPAADLDKVFTKFWRPSNQTWQSGGGPGLGLAIAKNIVDVHDGQVEAINQPAEIGGSVFSVKIPLINRSMSELAPFHQDAENTNPHYAALVITQSVDFGRVMQQTLGSNGFQVIVATDRSELVAETPAWQPDLIVNNAAEPDLLSEEDGKTLAPALRGAAILTLNLSPVEQRLIVAGAQAVLPWPAPESMLLETLEQTLMAEKPPEDLVAFRQKQTILLVSPSSETLRGLERLVRDAGYNRLHRATREADALTLARRYPPNWLLIDVPNEGENSEDELSLFELLREDQLLRRTPTIVFLRPEQIAPDLSSDYRPSFVGNSLRRVNGEEIRTRRGGTGELRSRSGTGELRNRSGTGELRSRGGTNELRARSGTGELNTRSSSTDELKGPFYNVVPKPFSQRRLLIVAHRLATKR